MTRKLFLFTSAFMSLTILFSFSYKAANFSGTWNLDESASELGQFGARAAASKIVVEQSAEGFKLIRSNTGFDGSTADVTENYTVGKATENTGMMNSKKTGTLAWDGEQSFKIDFDLRMEFQGNSFELKGSEKWEISADGKTLTLNTHLTTPQGDLDTKAVYKKG
jgi:hypothetical protein